MLDNKYVLQAFEIILPSIKVNQKLYIPMLDASLTPATLNSLPKYFPEPYKKN